LEITDYVTVSGRGGITATVIQDSVCYRTGTRITSFELEYPRFIHSEFMTHRLLSRNAASSRAIPVSKLISLIENKCATPIEWGKNVKGMQATEQLDLPSVIEASTLWRDIASTTCDTARRFDSLKLHKQIANRILEPYQMIKVVCTATTYDNFFHLRKHPDAQPEIKELATVMWKALKESNPIGLAAGEWHVPYIQREDMEVGLNYFIWEDQDNLEKEVVKRYLTREEAIKISASCCAQVSYRILNTDIDKANDIFAKLVESKPVHASPLEHQATPMSNLTNSCNSCDSWEKGVTHSDKGGVLWSGNFKYWIQHRQLIEDHVCLKYEE
jgi:thymidylate synthase ThyX